MWAIFAVLIRQDSHEAARKKIAALPGKLQIVYLFNTLYVPTEVIGETTPVFSFMVK